MDHKTIKQQAKTAVVGNRLLILVLLILSSVLASAGAVFLLGTGPLIAIVFNAGIYLTIKELLIENKKISFEVAAITYFKNYKHGLKVLVVGLLYTIMVAIGLALLIIPGIYLAIKYFPANYIIADNEKVEIFDAFRESDKLMNGKKADLLKFALSFIGHFLLGIITFGIYLLYILPYIKTAFINYYLYLTKAYDKTQIDPDIYELEF